MRFELRHFVTIAIILIAAVAAAQQTRVASIRLQIAKEAEAMKPLVKSAIGQQFLAEAPRLPGIPKPREVYFNPETREAMTAAEFRSSNLDSASGFARQLFEEDFYYTTRYGTPVAFVRALDLVGRAGLASLDNAAVCEFGFGSIGQLRIMANLGARVTGIEVDPILKALYSQPSDTVTEKGDLRLLFAYFPTDSGIVEQVGGGYDLFISKNTLKRGYIHPEKEVDPRMLVTLGVSDSAFVNTVYDLLKPGGYFMIYNLHPKYTPPDAPKYIPWSDGRSPFARELYQKIGFEVVAFDQDDTPFAHDMARAFGWDKQMDLSKDLFGMYTLLRRK